MMRHDGKDSTDVIPHIATQRHIPNSKIKGIAEGAPGLPSPPACRYTAANYAAQQPPVDREIPNNVTRKPAAQQPSRSLYSMPVVPANMDREPPPSHCHPVQCYRAIGRVARTR